MCKILKEMRITDHLTCLLRNLYACQEAMVRTRHAAKYSFQIRKGVWQGCILSPCLFNLHAEYIMWNARLNELQAGTNFAGRNIYSLRYARGTTKSEELENLLMRVKKERKKLAWNSTFKKLKSRHPLLALHWKQKEKSGSRDRFFFFFPAWAPKSLRTVTATMQLKQTCSLEGKLWQT